MNYLLFYWSFYFRDKDILSRDLIYKLLLSIRKRCAELINNKLYSTLGPKPSGWWIGWRPYHYLPTGWPEAKKMIHSHLWLKWQRCGAGPLSPTTASSCLLSFTCDSTPGYDSRVAGRGGLLRSGYHLHRLAFYQHSSSTKVSASAVSPPHNRTTDN